MKKMFAIFWILIVSVLEYPLSAQCVQPCFDFYVLTPNNWKINMVSGGLSGSKYMWVGEHILL